MKDKDEIKSGIAGQGAKKPSVKSSAGAKPASKRVAQNKKSTPPQSFDLTERDELLEEIRVLRAHLEALSQASSGQRLEAQAEFTNAFSSDADSIHDGPSLEEQQQRLRSLFELNPNAIFSLDRQGRFTSVNPGCTRISGYPSEAFLGKPFLPFVTEDTADVALETFNRVLAGETLTVFVASLGREGNRIELETTNVPIYMHGKVTGVFVIGQDITARLNAERALRQAEERHQVFVAQSSEAIWRYEVEKPFPFDLSVDEQLELCYKHAYLAESNDVMAQIYGHQKAEDVIGRRLEQLLPRTAENEAFLREFIASGYRVVDIESSRLDSRGQPHYYLSNMLGVVENGLVCRAWGSRRDITARKISEDALRESEKRLSLALRAGSMGTWDWNLETNIVSWSPLTEAMMGFEPGTFDGTYATFERTIHPDDREQVVWRIRRSVEQRVLFECEYRIVWDDGTVRWLSGLGAVVANGMGPVTRITGTVRDITRRKRRERAREVITEASAKLASSLEYENTLENVARLMVPDHADWCVIDLVEGPGTKRVAVAHVLPDKTPLLWEIERAARRSGNTICCTPPTLGAEPLLLTEVTPEQLAARCPDAEQTSLLRRAGLTSLMCIPLSARGRILGSMTLAFAGMQRRYENEDLEMAHELGRRIGIAVDNARLYHEAQETRRVAEIARREAEDANRAKDEFLAVVSHELRSPLTPMLGWLDLLKTGRLNESDTKRAFEIIERNARLQSQIVNDLLDVSRIVSGKLALDCEPLALHAVVLAAMETVQPLAREKEVEIVFENDAEDTFVNGDPGRLQQVVWNLLANAVKFSVAGSEVVVTLESRGRGVSDSLVLTVQDQGCGIAPEFLPYVFDRFRQADSTTTRRQGGLGLGLAIVRHIVTSHGGQISVTSEGASKGATFTVKLPRLNKGDYLKQAADALSGRDLKVDDNLQLNGVKVLLVDDEADTRELFVQMLETWRADVRAVESGERALELLRLESSHWRPAILISDIGMPNMDGYELMGRLRADAEWDDIPAIALTAYARDEDSSRALDAGFNRHLTKPIAGSTLHEAICQLIFADELRDEE